MLPDGSVMGMPAPMAAAMASSTRCTSLAFARLGAVLDGALFHLGDLGRHADHNTGPYPDRSIVGAS